MRAAASKRSACSSSRNDRPGHSAPRLSPRCGTWSSQRPHRCATGCAPSRWPASSSQPQRCGPRPQPTLSWPRPRKRWDPSPAVSRASMSSSPLNTRLERLVSEVAPNLLARPGVGPDVAAALLVAAGDNPERLRNEAAWAILCGVAPIEASSGKVTEPNNPLDSNSSVGSATRAQTPRAAPRSRLPTPPHPR